MKYYEKYMMFIGPLGNLMFFLQAYKIYITKTAISISVAGFSLSLVGLISWLLYGIFLKNKSLIVSNTVGFIGALLVLICSIIYS